MNSGRTIIYPPWTREKTLAYHDPFGYVDASSLIKASSGTPPLNQIMQESELEEPKQ